MWVNQKILVITEYLDVVWRGTLKATKTTMSERHGFTDDVMYHFNAQSIQCSVSL